MRRARKAYQHLARLLGINLTILTYLTVAFLLIAPVSVIGQSLCYDPALDDSQHSRFEPPPAGEPFILTIGDSNSLLRTSNQSWPARLKQILGIHVMNAALGGSIAGGPHPQDKANLEEDLAFSGPRQFEKAKLSIEPGAHATVMISMGGNDLMHFNDTAIGVIADLEALREQILNDPIFSFVEVYFIKIAPFVPDSPQGIEHGLKIDQINEYLQAEYGNQGYFIQHNPDFENYTDAVHFNEIEHLQRAQLVKEHILPGSDVSLKDSDQDGLNDGFEFFAGSLANDTDSDDDGINDLEEIIFGLDPANPDTDGDGIWDGVEIGISAGIPAGTSQCQNKPVYGSSSQFRGDSCPDTTSNPSIAIGDDPGVPVGASDIDGNGCLEKGASCQTVPLGESRDRLSSESSGLSSRAKRYLTSARRSCKLKRKFIKRKLEQLRESFERIQDVLSLIPEDYDICQDTSLFTCSLFSLVSQKELVLGTLSDLRKNIKLPARCSSSVGGRNSSLNKILLGLTRFEEMFGELPIEGVRCQ